MASPGRGHIRYKVLVAALGGLLFSMLLLAVAYGTRNHGRMILNQGPFPRCSSYAVTAFLLNDDAPHRYVNPDWLFMEALKVDGIPDNEGGEIQDGGTHVFAVVHVLTLHGYLHSALQTTSATRAYGWLQYDPVIVTSRWFSTAMNTLHDGYVLPPTIEEAVRMEKSGHAYLCYDRQGEDTWLCQNSWGPYWGDRGLFKIHTNDVQRLVSEFGGVIHKPIKTRPMGPAERLER